MRITLTIIWAIALFIFTCSFNFHQLITEHYIHFVHNSHPDWSELFKLDFEFDDSEWVTRKIGHFVGFGLLGVLASNFGKYKSAFLYSVMYAALTEVLQLFFFRGGRIYDIINDSAGILFAYVVCRIVFGTSQRHKRKVK
ncbi:VanZ family protein [Paenibacillus protaetiae]|uniref:VanZ family protein n=1 Tax=Paenibacillus protaetiae TaxID=2509456 RepID=UPI0013EAB0AD|nr:VanZ family protein [Paenibacillus protaetiae]